MAASPGTAQDEGSPSRAEPAALPAVPSGTVTFLFTDIEGSTRLLEQLREQYAAVLADQRELLRAAFAEHHGLEIDTQGDAFFVAFPRALDAIGCVVAAQRALAEHAWPQGVSVRVRMGLHTGEPLVARTGYVGMDVHRAARIAAAGHGGQVLLSQTTRELVYQDLPGGLALRELGEHQLKDIRFPQHLYQLDIDGLPADFPPLKTGLAAEAPPTPGEPPYQGLEYFDESDAAHFFGREALTGKLVEWLCAERFLAVIGASGSGKSSVVRAGLVPALKRGGRLRAGEPSRCPGVRWQVHVLTPTAHPLEALATSLTRQSESVTAAATLMDDLRREPRSLHLFVSRQLQLAQRGSGAAPDRLLIVIDQLEELFTLCRDESERRAFVDNLLTAVAAEGGGLSLLLALRADFYEHLAAYPALSAAVAQHQEYLGAMDADELRQAIEAPAAQGGWALSPGLVDLLLHDVGAEPGALPLLSHALLETWKRRRGNLLNLRAYSESGGVRGAIARTAEGVFSQELTAEQQRIARNIFLRLTEPGEGTQDTRRRVRMDELLSSSSVDAQLIGEVIDRLANARLVTASEDTLEVAHEALIREWPQLRQWLNEDREGLRLHRHLTGAAQAWEHSARDAGELYRGARLAQAAEWAAGHTGDLNALEREFLDASRALAEQEQAEREAQRQRELEAARRLAEAEQQRAEEQTRLAQQLRRRAVGLASALLVAAVLAVVVALVGLQARRDSQLSVSRELAIAAVNNLGTDPERSLLLALRGISIARSREAENALHQAIAVSRVRLTLVGHAGEVFAAAFSPDGTRLATASADGTVSVWSLGRGTAAEPGAGEPLFTLLGHSGPVHSLAYSPDGRRLATGSDDGTARIWDAATGQERQTLSGHQSGVSAVNFSPDGESLATVSIDGVVIVWTVATGQEQLRLAAEGGGLPAVGFDPGGRRLATAGDQSTTIWDVREEREVVTLPKLAAPVAWSPDGQRIAGANPSTGAVRLLEVPSGQEVFEQGQSAALIYSVAFNADGTRLATGHQDGQAIVWDGASGAELFRLTGHSAAVNGIAFSPDCTGPPEAPFALCGPRLATTSADSTARVWDVSPMGEGELLTLPGFNAFFSPDGARLHTVSFEGPGSPMSILEQGWEPSSSGGRELLRVRYAQAAPIVAGNASPDLTRRVLVTADQRATIWDGATGRQLFAFPLTGQTAPVWAVVFSPDSRQLATSAEDGSIRLWDLAAQGQLALALDGHTGPVAALAYSRDGSRLASASFDGTAKVWDTASGQALLTLTGHTNWVASVAFSPDGRRLATGSRDARVIVWDATTGAALRVLAGHTGTVGSVAFSPDGARLATTSVDGTTRLWDAGSGEELLRLGSRGARAVIFSPDGARLATAGESVHVYVLPVEDLVALAKTRVTRSLTAAECQQYLHTETCPPP